VIYIALLQVYIIYCILFTIITRHELDENRSVLYVKVKYFIVFG